MGISRKIVINKIKSLEWDLEITNITRCIEKAKPGKKTKKEWGEKEEENQENMR